MSDQNQDNKVVPFPTHKVKKPKTDGKPTMVQSIDQNRKVTLFLSLMSTLLLATLLSSRLNQPVLNESSRNIASRDEVDRPDLDEEIVRAKKIARESLREPASRGREPTAEEILRHGEELASVYDLDFSSDTRALVGLRYNGTPGRAHILKDGRAAFLMKHKDLLQLQFNKVVHVETVEEQVKDEVRLIDVYELRQNETPKARVYYKIDKEERVYSMNVELI